MGNAGGQIVSSARIMSSAWIMSREIFFGQMIKIASGKLSGGQVIHGPCELDTIDKNLKVLNNFKTLKIFIYFFDI